MWLRRFLRAGDAISAGLRPIGAFFKKWYEELFFTAFMVCLIGGIGVGAWYLTSYQEEPAPADVVKSAMAEGACLSNNISSALASNRVVTRRGIRRARNGCEDSAKEAAALAEQLKLLPKKADQVTPEVVNRPATPTEITAAAKADECVRETIPGWRRNIGGGPIMVNDLPEMRIACNNLHTLNAQLAAIPK